MNEFSLVLFVICCCRPVLRDTHQTFHGPFRQPPKAILSPSGDQLCSQLWPTSDVTGVSGPPLLGMMYRLLCSFSFLSTANIVPSGDQVGHPIVPCSKVSCLTCPLSTLRIQTFVAPSFVELNAICFPS